MAEKTDQPTSPLKPPAGARRDWREKIETAREAREMGKQMRKGKELSFRRAVGRTV